MKKVAVVGLGYVGLPLAIEFGKYYQTLGFDISEQKISSYQRNNDPTGEVSSEDFEQSIHLKFTNDPSLLSGADYIIVAVPTPIDSAKQPDFGPLVSASRTVGQHMKKGSIVVYESTVYPGATEEVCVPILEQHSHMKWKEDFHVGYSPERINPGDKEHTLTRIIKVVSGDDLETQEAISDLYASIISAGVYRAPTIKIAEAAKVIENTQRDLNIALMNELSIIFNRMEIDTTEVLSAAGTKWNFLKFNPGLVGGHCIGVDPYYLTYKSEMLGYHPDVILAGRRINDSMGKHIAEQTVKRMIDAGIQIKNAKVNILGLTFKEDVPDLRNSKVIDIINELKSYGLQIFVHDPIADPEQAYDEYGVELLAWEQLPCSDAIVAAVAHRKLVEMPIDRMKSKVKGSGCFIDVKSKFNNSSLTEQGISVWKL